MHNQDGVYMSNFFDAFDTVKQAEQGATLHFKLPQTGEYAYNEGTPLTITFKGPKSAAGRQAGSRLAAKMGAILRKYKKNPDSLLSDDDSAALRKIKAESYASLATAWTGFEKDGKDIPLTPDNVYEMLISYWDLLDQASEFMESKDSFLKS